MKKIFMCLAAAAAVVSCVTNDFNANIGGNIDTNTGSGDFSTHATFSFKSSASSTSRALPNDAGESDVINDGKLLIFEATGSKTLSYIGDIVLGGTTTVATISGDKRIFVLVNTEDSNAVTTLLSGLTKDATTLSDFYALMGNAKENDNAAELGAYFTEITAAGKTFMSNGASAESVYTIMPEVTYLDSQNNVNDPEYNNFTIYVKRATAKARLAVSTSIIDGNNEATTTDGRAKLKVTGATMLYGIRNLNRSTYLTQQFESDETSDNDAGAVAPSDAKTRPCAPYYSAFSALTTEELTKELFEQYYFDGDFDVAMGAIDYSYIPENSNDKAVVGNSTYWGIKAEVSAIAGAHLASSVTLANGTADKLPILERLYTVADSSATAVNGFVSVNSSTFYSIRANQLTGNGSIFIGAARYFTDKTLAFETLYTLLEAAGHIGTPANNDPTLGAGIVLDTDCEAAGDLYFATAAAFEAGYNDTVIAAINAKLEAAADAAPDANLPTSLDYVIGIFDSAKCYYRLNIFEKGGDEEFNIVRRNHAYAGTITSFATIGTPESAELEENPGDPVDKTQTYVSAQIEIQDWRDVEVDGGV